MNTYISHVCIATRQQQVREFLVFYSNNGNEMGLYYIMARCITKIVSENELGGGGCCVFLGGGRGNASSRLIDRPKVQVRSVDRLMAWEWFTQKLRPMMNYTRMQMNSLGNILTYCFLFAILGHNSSTPSPTSGRTATVPVPTVNLAIHPLRGVSTQ